MSLHDTVSLRCVRDSRPELNSVVVIHFLGSLGEVFSRIVGCEDLWNYSLQVANISDAGLSKLEYVAPCGCEVR